jgi:hypothetical protein
LASSLVHALFKRENRLHVDSIAFTVPRARRSDHSRARWFSEDMVMLNNPSPRFECPELRGDLSRRRVTPIRGAARLPSICPSPKARPDIYKHFDHGVLTGGDRKQFLSVFVKPSVEYD